VNMTPMRMPFVGTTVEIHPGIIGKGSEFATVIVWLFTDTEGIICSDMDDSSKERIRNVCFGMEDAKDKENG